MSTTINPGISDPGLCIVHTRAGDRVPAELASMLDPVDPATFHEYVLQASTPVELHGHDYDEYWWFTGGSPIVTLWTPHSGAQDFAVQPGDLVVLVRGMAHTLSADHALTYFQFQSLRRAGSRDGHILPEDLENAPVTPARVF